MSDEKRSAMLRHLQDWQRQGGSLRGYALSQDVPYSQLTYWRKRLEPELDAVTDPVGFVEIYSPEVDAGDDRLEVRLRSGQVLRVPHGFDGKELKRLVVMLEGC